MTEGVQRTNVHAPRSTDERISPNTSVPGPALASSLTPEMV